ncbi:integrin beta-like protein A [Magallana gigas]|uniref:integrin beta-like protein A n=1 Tax=Magallana gigas TaxID=29159 RepID=UPI00333E65F4
MHLTVIQVFYVLFPFYHGMGATHFRGGTISWKPIGNGTKVEFSFKLGWAYNRGPGCTAERIGQFIDEVIPYYWKCTTGCSTPRNIANTSYICTGASESENWEQGENTFTYTFPGIGPYTVEFTGSDWMNLSYGSPGRWSIGTVVNLATRNDTNKPNLSPITTGKPIYVAQYGCYNEISIPVVDPNGDDVRCRWANGTECMSICEGLPYATIDYNNCTIRFMANHTSNGTFAVAVTVEDYPKSNISIDGSIHLTTSPLSTITLQFIVETPVLPAVNCTDKPRFVRPTLAEGTILHTDIFKSVNISFFSSGNSGIANIDLTVPAGMEYTSLQSDVYTNYSYVHSSWIPEQNQVGFHLVCAIAKDPSGKTSKPRCITVVVNDVSPCNINPCEHGGRCLRQDITQNYVCTCLPRYTGNYCETGVLEMFQPVVLKKRHSLKWLTLLPVIRKVKDGRLENVKELARISVGKRTEALQLRDIAKAVMEITGESMDELLDLAGKDIRDYDSAKLLLHYCVLAANERGQPKGQVLQDDEAGPSTSCAPAERQNQTEDNTVELLCLIYCVCVCVCVCVWKKN